MRVFVAAALLLASAGCVVPITIFGALQPYYSAGDFRREYADKTHALGAVGCLDLAPAIRDVSGTVIMDFRAGNRCGDTVTVDLTQLHVYSTKGDGERVPASLVDPNGEIRPLPLPARGQAFEPIALRGVPPERGSATELCLDFSSIAPARPTETAHATLCFVHTEDRWLAAPGSRS